MRDMTRGGVAGNIAVFSVPLVFDNMFQQLYGVVNSVVAGRCLGSAALAATGTAIPVMNIATFLLCGMTLGAAVLMAEFFGARQFDRLKRECGTAFSVGVVFTLLLSVAGIFCVRPALALIKAPSEIAPQAAAYLKIIFAGLLFSFLYNFFSSSLRAVGESAAPLYFLVAASLLNLGLALLFVGRLGLGVRGAALATVISQAAAALFCFLYIYACVPVLRFDFRSLIPDRSLLARTASYSSVSGIQQTVLYVGVFLLQGAVNPLGVTAIAAFNGVCRIDGFVMAFGDSLATALMMFISQNLGAGRGDRALKGLRGTLLLNLAVTGSLIVLLLTAPRALMSVFLDKGEAAALTTGVRYLRLMAPFYLLGVFCNTFQGFFRGLGRMDVVFYATLIQIPVRVISAYTLAGSMKINAVAVATAAGWFCMAAYQAWSGRKYLGARGILAAGGAKNYEISL